MGFLQGLGRIIAGKPVFEPTADVKEDKTDSKESGNDRHRFVDERGYKIIPEIELSRLKSRLSGDRMEVTVWATNTSKEHVRLDYMILLGQKQTIMRELPAGQGHEVRLYDGPVAVNEHDTRAELMFRRLADSDNFSIVYYVEFNREADNQFIVEELHVDGPARDI